MDKLSSSTHERNEVGEHLNIEFVSLMWVLVLREREVTIEVKIEESELWSTRIFKKRKRWEKRERASFTAGTGVGEVGGCRREGECGFAVWKRVVGGGSGGDTGQELEQSRVQLSLWRGRSTEGFIVICNYVVFCGASV